MKKASSFSFLIAIVLLICSCTNNDFTKFPDYTTVVKEFYKNYARSSSANGAISFEKRKEGWFAVFKDYTSGKPVTTESWEIWSARESKFQPLKFKGNPDRESNSLEEKQALNQVYAQYYFRICPYYGYVGWDKDVMDDFDGKSGLSDSTLFAVAHAYSTYAMGLLSENSGYSDDKVRFKLQEKANCLSAEQLAEYRKYQHRATELMEEVKKMNPKFETFIGDIDNKISNEYMNAFLTLLYYQNEAEAMKEIPKELYDPFFISIAKNYLSSCEKNAVLFTNGDNDTYPLLYVQAKLGYRRDVLVANASLLQTSRYINFMRTKVFDASPMNLSIPQAEYQKSRYEIVMMVKRESEKPCVSPAQEIVSNVLNPQTDLAYSNTKYPAIYCNNISLATAGGTMNWKLDAQYIYRGELAELDLLATEKLSRPVYFGTTVAPRTWLGLDKYMKQQGLAHKISTEEKNAFAPVPDLNVMYDNLMNKFSYEGLKENKSDMRKSFVLNYLSSAGSLASALVKENKKDSAVRVLDKMQEAIPNKIFPYGGEVYMFPDVYFTAGKTQKAFEICDIIIFNMNKICADPKSKGFEENMNRRASIFNYLNQLGAKYNQPDLLRKTKI